jgi:hypothetical protein
VWKLDSESKPILSHKYIAQDICADNLYYFLDVSLENMEFEPVVVDYPHHNKLG